MHMLIWRAQIFLCTCAKVWSKFQRIFRIFCLVRDFENIFIQKIEQKNKEIIYNDCFWDFIDYWMNRKKSSKYGESKRKKIEPERNEEEKAEGNMRFTVSYLDASCMLRKFIRFTDFIRFTWQKAPTVANHFTGTLQIQIHFIAPSPEFSMLNGHFSGFLFYFPPICEWRKSFLR